MTRRPYRLAVCAAGTLAVLAGPGVGAAFAVPATPTAAQCTVTDNGPGDLNPAVGTIQGGGADDVICGGPGADYIRGGAGNDRLYGDAGNDTILGGADNDILIGGDGDDILAGETGSDQFSGGTGIDRITYSTTKANTRISLQNNSATPFNGSDGANAEDSYTTGNGVTSPAENDRIYNNIEDLRGGSGADRLTGNDRANDLDGGVGGDTMFGLGGNDFLQGKVGPDTLSGGDGNDRLSGGSESDAVQGNAGDDTTFVEANADGNNDVYTGGTGIDTLNLAARTTPVRITLDQNDDDDGAYDPANPTGESPEGDNVITTENVVTGVGADRLIGNDSANVFQSNGGNDLLDGQAGTDTLSSGSGDDRVIGDDSDTTVFTDGPFADVLDCGKGADTRVVDALDTFVGCETAG